MEGLNQEIERIIICDAGERDDPHHVPDGRRAPPPLSQRPSSPSIISQCYSSSAFRSINTQTPQGGRGACGGGAVSNSSRSESVSPSFLTVPTDTEMTGERGGDGVGESPLPNSDELLTNCREKGEDCPREHQIHSRDPPSLPTSLLVNKYNCIYTDYFFYEPD